MSGYSSGSSGISAVNYSTTEQTLNETWTGGETLYQKVINTGALPNATTKNTAHAITSLGTVVKIEGCADNGTGQIPLPYHAADADQVRVYSDDTNVVLIAANDYSAYTASHVILTYTKSA